MGGGVGLAFEPGGLGQQMEAVQVARLRLGGGQRVDRDMIVAGRRAEEGQGLLLAETGKLGRLEIGAGPVGLLDQGVQGAGWPSWAGRPKRTWTAVSSLCSKSR